MCPAHNQKHNNYSITGGYRSNETIKEVAIHELWEEAGYKAEQKELIDLGEVRPSKNEDTIVYLFSIESKSQRRSMARNRY